MPTHSILNRLPHDPRSQRGFTLIELMISLVIGLLLSAAIVKVYADTSQIYKFQNALSEVQENGRFASAFLRRAARLAGNFGCDASQPIAASTIPAATDTRLGFHLATTAQPIGGVEGATAAAPDQLILRGSTGGGVRLELPNPATIADPLTVETTAGLTNDGFAVISDCAQTHIFSITGLGGGGTTITHSGTTALYTFEGGARVQEIQVIQYCIGQATAWTATNNLMALKRLRNPGAAENCPDPGVGEELVEGIQNLQVSYGVDTNNDTFANRYINAPAALGDALWASVKTLRIELVARSLANGITRNLVPYTLGGVEVPLAANDRYLYKVMTNTITLRNKGT